MLVSRKKTGIPVDKSSISASMQEVTEAGSLEKFLLPARPMVPSSAHPQPMLIGSPPPPRLPAGGKAVNTAPVPGQTPHDESDRRTEPRSSVSDLVNSLTSEMLMVRRVEGL